MIQMKLFRIINFKIALHIDYQIGEQSHMSLHKDQK